MPSIANVEYDHLDRLWSDIEPRIAAMATLQQAAGIFTTTLYERFGSSIALVRTFCTVELQQLPVDDRAFVETFAAEHAPSQTLNDATPVLCLLATRGVEPDWNDRTRSRAHRAIPLISEQFVAEIPMIACLLDEIGFTPAWEGTRSGFVTKSLANVNGVFYVSDPRNAVDDNDRRIIPASDFLERYDVRTVFGFGGSYLSRHLFLTTIVFARASVMRSQATMFVPLIGSLKAATTRMVNRGAIFGPG